MTARQRLVNVAKSLVGVRWRHGQTAQCANFVRYVFSQAQVPVGVADPPDDIKLLPAGSPLGASYADSFAGDEVGRKVGIDALQSGDIIMWRNTHGSYPQGVITHVGLMVDSKYFIHRPTADRPVELASLTDHWRTLFSQARRPVACMETATTAKLYAHGTKARTMFGGVEGDGIFKLYIHSGRGSVVAYPVGGDPVEYTTGQVTITHRKDSQTVVRVDHGKPQITRADGAVGDGEKIWCDIVLAVRAGDLEGSYNLGYGSVDADRDAAIECIFRR